MPMSQPGHILMTTSLLDRLEFSAAPGQVNMCCDELGMMAARNGLNLPLPSRGIESSRVICHMLNMQSGGPAGIRVCFIPMRGGGIGLTGGMNGIC
jgi:hypothetical protein